MAQGQRGSGGGPPKKKEPGFSNNPFTALKVLKEQQKREKQAQVDAAKAARAAPSRGTAPPGRGLPPPGRAGKGRSEAPASADDDALLFLSAVDGVKEIPRPRGEPPRVDVRLPQRLQEDNAEVLAQLSDLVAGEDDFDFAPSEAFIEGAHPGADPQLMRSLREGRFGIQGELDLHGKTRSEARAAVDRFLSDARRTKKRCVLIVHGRGLNSPEQVPVLKQALRGWLSQKRLSSGVLAFCSARPQDGGAGAVYVLLRR